VVYQQEEGKTGDARDVPFDGKTLGEIVVRGNIVMKEVRVLLAITLIKIARLMGLAKYFKNPDATQKAFEGGYFRTGDLAVRYQDGSVGISDRSKDLIISGGEASIAVDAARGFILTIWGLFAEC
jgi:acyl-CoA synthetase (AMP-forming)/AMP-acid ligase II